MELDRLKDIKLHGAAKFFHVVFMVLTYPLRHPFRFVFFAAAVALALAVVPLRQGVAWRDVLKWYMPVPETSVSDVAVAKPKSQHKLPYPHVASQPVVAPEPDDSPLLPPPSEVKLPKQYKPMKLPESWQARESVQAEKVLEEDKQVVVQEPQANVEVLVAPSSEIAPKIEQKTKPMPKPAYRKLDTLPLVYEEKPKRIRGKAMVFSPNELTVGKTYMFLYGIYTDPQKHGMVAAEQYLTDLVRGKRLECDLVAYTYDNLPTGVCYIDGRSVNQNMVDAGFADNIAL